MHSIHVTLHKVMRKLQTELPVTAWERSGAITHVDGDTDIGIGRMTEQDIAVIGMIFGACWNKALACEASSRPVNLKASAMNKLLKECWKPCQVKLKAGLHTKQSYNNRHVLAPASIHTHTTTTTTTTHNHTTHTDTYSMGSRCWILFGNIGPIPKRVTSLWGKSSLNYECTTTVFPQFTIQKIKRHHCMSIGLQLEKHFVRVPNLLVLK